MFYTNAFIVSVIPVFLYTRIHMMELVPSSPLFAIMTAVSTYLVAFAYKNSKFLLKHKIAQKIEQSVTKDVVKQIGEKKTGKSEKDERVLWKKNEVSESSATQFALFYTNAMFVLFLMFGSFMFFKSFSPMMNYILTMALAAGLVALFSTSTSK